MSKDYVCSVKHIKRVDIAERSGSSGDDDYCYTDTEEKEALDILEKEGVYYVAATKTYYTHHYDQYESPMNRYFERTTLEICEISEDKLGYTKDGLLAYMNESDRIWGHHDKAVYPSETFVAEQVERALKKRDDEIRIAEKESRGECVPNAVYVSCNGEASLIYIDDFSTNEGLAAALNCDAVKISYPEKMPGISYFYNAKIIYEIPYNRVASALFDTSLEGTIVICAEEGGKPAPFSQEDAEKLAELVRLKKAFTEM